jgi:hypothetical protein
MQPFTMLKRIGVAGIVVISLGVSRACAQSIEPRAYSNAPVGVNFLVAGYAYTSGGLSTDPALPITDDHIRTSSAVLAYARTLDLWGNSGKFDVIVPYTELDGSADYASVPVERHVSGLADPAFRLSMNFYGAPAMALKDFAGYRQDLIAGASLQVSPPLGQYDASRIVNLGTHRWTFKPELGVSKTQGPWTLEAKAAATAFTDNRDFNGGKVRSQDPIYSFSGHAIYNFASGIWASCDATYFSGGRTTIDGAQANDLQQNWRAGATLAIPVDRLNSLKLYASRGLSARTGNSFDLVGIAWQLRWGGGL